MSKRSLAAAAATATLALSLLVTVALYAVRLAPLESVLTARGHGIVALELAGTGPRFTAVMNDWGVEGVAAARAQTPADRATPATTSM